ncbi:MAG: TIGR03617 family F420-dependent LLM class oxidoreductase [Gammaproteobacteria bacterium]|nr:TIGR03617 family F420-dependent LLM class oxidoreductase [Gammaproteobacteria bacterium]
MKVVTGIGSVPESVGAQAKRAEQAGFDIVTCGELAHDSIVTMTLAAAATERIGLQTSVTIAFPRSPMVLAMEAWDIQRLSKGRFTIGLGSQVKGHNERRFGGTWTAPAPRMSEYIQMMRAIWESWQKSSKAEFLGKHYRYTLMTPAFNPGPIEFPHPKIGLAMVGTGMAAVAGEFADVAMPHGGIMSDKYMRQALLPAIRRGLVRAGRSWSDIEIAESGYLVLADSDEELERKLDAMRQPLSFYGSTRTYHSVLEMHGLGELGQKLHALSIQGKWAEMVSTVTNDDILKLADTCRYDEYPRFLKEKREYASRTSFSMPRNSPQQEERYQRLLNEIQRLECPAVPSGLEI